MEITTKDAVEQLIKALKEDPEYYYSWQANIAMAFKDEYNNSARKDVEHYLMFNEFKHTDLHTVANKAAQNFLNLLIR